jgi:hypothetical protein
LTSSWLYFADAAAAAGIRQMVFILVHFMFTMDDQAFLAGSFSKNAETSISEA